MSDWMVTVPASNIRSRSRLGAGVVVAAVGFGIVIFPLGGVPSALFGSDNFGTLQFVVALCAVFSVAAVLILNRFPYPDAWGVLSLLGGLWAIS